MNIIVSNNAEIPNKFVRFIKWKIYNLQSKFKNLLYAEVFILKEGTSKISFISKIKMGVEGADIMLVQKDVNLNQLWKKSSKAMQRYLRKDKERKVQLSQQ